MRMLGLSAVAAASVVLSGTLQAETLKSGPQLGDSVGAFTVEKCAGNDADGVEQGEKLCYRCMLGNRPVVAVFARKNDKRLAALVKELDSIVAKNEAKKVAAFVNLLGENPRSLKDEATKLVKDSKAMKVAVVVPVDHKQGPENYKLNPKADVTVLVYKQGRVRANFALPSEKLDSDTIKKISKSAVEMLN